MAVGEKISRRGRLAVVGAIAVIAVMGAQADARPPHTGKAAGEESVKRFPWEKRMKAAKGFARGRAGSVSFALVDEFGHLHGFHRGARYSSASVVKAMLLVAYLRKGDVKRRRLHGSERALLRPMVTRSDNDAASAVMDRVGTGGLARLARRAGMRRFIPDEVWGGSQITARDQAVYFSRIARLLPRRHRAYGLGLLRSVIPGQRWGTPAGAPSHWRLYFKGGWVPSSGGGWRVHQAALLRQGKRRLSLAVLTEGGPSLGYGAATITGVVRRLLRGYNRWEGPGRPKRKGKGNRRTNYLKVVSWNQARGPTLSGREATDMTPSTATQNLNSKLRTERYIPPLRVTGVNWQSTPVRTSTPPVRIATVRASYQGGYRIDV